MYSPLILSSAPRLGGAGEAAPDMAESALFGLEPALSPSLKVGTTKATSEAASAQ